MDLITYSMKEMARILSKSKGISYQKALSDIAIIYGYEDWNQARKVNGEIDYNNLLQAIEQMALIFSKSRDVSYSISLDKVSSLFGYHSWAEAKLKNENKNKHKY